jgi:hypothetical protein
MANYDETAKTAATPKASETSDAKEATATADTAKAPASPIATPAKAAEAATESERRTPGGNDHVDQGSLAMARRPVDVGAGPLESVAVQSSRFPVSERGRYNRFYGEHIP